MLSDNVIPFPAAKPSWRKIACEECNRYIDGDPDSTLEHLSNCKGPRKYTTAAEDAKEIRKGLKAAFPWVKFSVRSSSYSMGSSIRICWTDGPTVEEVQAVTARYEQIDRDSYSGEILSGGNRFVFEERECSEKLRAYAQAFVPGNVAGYDAETWLYRELRKISVQADGSMVRREGY